VIAQDLSEEFLNVTICATSDDGSDEFDFDAYFAIGIDFAFHTQVYRAVPKAQEKPGICLLPCCQLSQLQRCVLTCDCQQRRSRPKSLLQLVLVGFAKTKMLCTGEYQSPVLSRDGKINFEAMSRCNDVGECSHRGLC